MISAGCVALDCARATRAHVLETVRGAVRRTSRITPLNVIIVIIVIIIIIIIVVVVVTIITIVIIITIIISITTPLATGTADLRDGSA